MVNTGGRWYGPDDPVSLDDVRQAGASHIVSALHQVPIGEAWTQAAVEERKNLLQAYDLKGFERSTNMQLKRIADLEMFNEQYSLTLQNGYNLIQQGIVPVPGIIGHPSRYETDQSARLGILQTGTSFTAGQAFSSTDDRWLSRLSAEQKLFDGVTVSGSVSETAQGTANKSFTAGFKRSW